MSLHILLLKASGCYSITWLPPLLLSSSSSSGGRPFSFAFTVGVFEGNNPVLSKDALMAPLSNCKTSQCWVSMEPILLHFAVRTTANYVRHFSYCCDKIPNKRKVWSPECVSAHSRRAHFSVSGKAWGERSLRLLVTLCLLSGRGNAGTQLAFSFWEAYLLLFLFFEIAQWAFHFS